MKFDIEPRTNEEYVSVTYGCISFIDSYRFLSSSLDSLLKTFVDNGYKTMKNLKKEFVDNEEYLNIIIVVGEEDKTVESLKKDCPKTINESEGTLLNYMSENDLKI